MSKSPTTKQRKRVTCETDLVYEAASAIGQVLRGAESAVSAEAIKDFVDFASKLSHEPARDLFLQYGDPGFWIHAIDSVLIIAVTDTNGTILYANSKFCDISGYTKGELVGANHRLINSGFHGRRFFREMYATIRAGRIWRGEICNRAKDGSIYWVATTIIPQLDTSGKVRQYVACRFDITEQKRAQQQLTAVANIDPLTGLLNRRAFQSELTKIVDRWADGRQKTALVLLDLDNFKDINDIYGHEAGDELLKAVSTRIRQSVRSTDVVARLGGDEFAVVFTPLPSQRRLVNLLDAIRDAVAIPAFDGSKVNVSTSMGIACLPEHGATPLELVRNADIALYSAKRLGRNRYDFFTPALQDAAIRRISMVDQARKGLRAGQFCVHYQPIVSLLEERLTGVEASLRWAHPNLGLIVPSIFAEVFEDLRLAAEIGDFVRGAAVSQIADWTKNGISFGKVAINPTSADFLTANYCDRFLKLLFSEGLSQDVISIEVSEEMFLSKDATRVREEIHRLHAAGFEIALNNFGAGYAALTHLKELPLNGISIDRSLVHELASNRTDQNIIRGVVDLAHSLNLDVTAKGIETQEQLDLLRNMGCDRGQGYLLSKPLPAENVPLLIRELGLRRRRVKHRKP